MENREIAALFERIAALLEIDEGNPFRIRSFQRAAQVIADLPFSAEKAVTEFPEELKKVQGIGKGTFNRIQEILKTGTCTELKELGEKMPPGLVDMLRIQGLGPRKISLFWRKLGISSLEQLENAAREQRLRGLAGMGPRSEVKILESVQFLKNTTNRFRLDQGLTVSHRMINHLKTHGVVERIAVAGSVRRRQETIGDIDILVTSQSPEKASEVFLRYPEVSEIIARGPTKSSVRLKSGISCDLRVLEDECFGAALQYFTGSRAHNVAIREQAKRRGLKINEYGVFTIDDEKRVAGKNEAEIYKLMGLDFIPPELRENRGEMEAATAKIPELIEAKDIRGDLHCHTTASDGKDTLEEMAREARQLGYAYIAVTDHSQSLAMTGGLDERRLLEQSERIDRFNNSNPGITVLKGIEVDILADGRLDLDDTVLAEMDVVIASVHSRFDMTSREMTRRVCRALEHPSVNVLGHPTGRLLLQREPYRLELGTVMNTARDNRVCLEVNSLPKRLDLSDVNCRMAKDMGLLLSINTDSHSCQGLRVIEYGIYTARRGWISAEEVINTYPLDLLRKILNKTHYRQ